MALKKLKDMSPTERLLSILSYKRPHNSEAERVFVDRFVIPLKDLPKVTMEKCEGATIFTVPHKVGDVRPLDTMFSCHVDTVHSTGGSQKVVYDRNMMIAYKDDNQPLGADDGTGVWIMGEMMRAAVPGVYVFHRGEERGCIGSGWIADNKVEWLKQFKRAIAFDRRDNDNVITRQRGRECCSDAFAKELAEELNYWSATLKQGKPFDYKPDPTGVYTDTASYDHIIPECTNLSVGYVGQHSAGETQDVGHALDLLEVACALDWHGLVTRREPVEKYQWKGGNSGRFFGGGWGEDDLPGWPPGTTWRRPMGALPTRNMPTTSTTSGAPGNSASRSDQRGAYSVEFFPIHEYDPYEFVGSSEQEVLEQVVTDPAGIAEFIVEVSRLLALQLEAEDAAAPQPVRVLNATTAAGAGTGAVPDWFVRLRNENEAQLRAEEEARDRARNDPGAIVTAGTAPPIPD